MASSIFNIQYSIFENSILSETEGPATSNIEIRDLSILLYRTNNPVILTSENLVRPVQRLHRSLNAENYNKNWKS